jgi:hypothetical protein
MGILFLVLGALTLTVAGMFWLALAGFRHGDRLLDAVVTAELQQSAQPDESRPVVVAEIRNSSESAALVGLAARRRRADRYPVVGIVPASGSTRLTVPVTETGERYRLTAVIGQAGGRLRVHRLMVDDRARLWLPVADLTGWPR